MSLVTNFVCLSVRPSVGSVGFLSGYGSAPQQCCTGHFVFSGADWPGENHTSTSTDNNASEVSVRSVKVRSTSSPLSISIATSEVFTKNE